MFENTRVWEQQTREKMTASWDIAPCSLVEVNLFYRIRPTLVRLQSGIFQEAVIFILAAMRTPEISQTMKKFVEIKRRKKCEGLFR
jgi:hypothetical protein